MAAVDSLPAKVVRADTEGLNDAYEAIVASADDAEELAELLTRRPKDVIRRVMRLNPVQRATLAEMSNHEVADLVRPILETLKSNDPTAPRGFRLVEQVVRESPLRVRCRVEIDIDNGGRPK